MTTPILIITVDGRVQFVITGPENITIGQKVLDMNYAALEINNLVDGKYILTLLSPYKDD